MTRSSPAARSASALRARSEAFVVSVRSRPSIASSRSTSVSSSFRQERLAARQADLLDAELCEHAGDPLQLLEREELLAVHEAVVVAEHRLRHAVGAAEVAPVGDRDTEVADRPSQSVDGVHTESVLGTPGPPVSRIASRGAAHRSPDPRARRGHGDLGLHVRPGAEGARRLSALRLPRRAVRDLRARARPVSRGPRFGRCRGPAGARASSPAGSSPPLTRSRRPGST